MIEPWNEPNNDAMIPCDCCKESYPESELLPGYSYRFNSGKRQLMTTICVDCSNCAEVIKS